MFSSRNLLVLLFSINILSLSAQNTLEDFFDKADQFFQKNVAHGMVDYESIHTNQTDLITLTTMMSGLKLDGKTEEEKKAYWINAYNITMIKAIIRHYPVKSPLDIPGLFDKEKHPIAGESITLESIEKQKLMSVYKDPRLHFVLVCAAIGCPELADFAYRPDGIDAMLDQRTVKAMDNNYFTRLDLLSKTVRLSQIFVWYKSDFLISAKSLLDYVNTYRTSKIPAGYKVGYYEYNWSLNIKKK